MQNLDLILFLQHVYAVATKKLWSIGSHPDHVEKGHLGYFMSLENIKEVIKSIDPQDWYKEEPYEGKLITLEDLPVEDRWKLEEVINDLTARSTCQSHLVKKCNDCMRLCMEFNDKILKLHSEKVVLKKTG